MNDKKMLLNRLSALQFTMWELHIYLDTHPHDRAAFSMYEKYKKEVACAQKEYEEKFGCLKSADCENGEWLKEPWPWQYEGSDN